MPTFITTSNGASVTLPARSRAFEFTVWGAGGGSGGVDAGGTGGRGGDGSRLFGTVQDSSFGRTITAYVGGGGGGGGGCVASAGGGGAGSSSVAAGGTGGNTGGSGCSGGGGGGGGASALYLGGDVIAVAGGGGGGGGANLNTGQSGGGGDSLSRGTTTSLSLSGGQNGTNKSGDGAGAGAGGGGSDGGGTGLVGQDRSFGATGGSGGRSYYNTTFVSTVSHFGNGDQSYGYGTPNGNSISGTAGAVSVVYPRLDFFGIAIGTENSTEGNVTGTVGDSVELTWATTDVDDVLINSVNEGNASNGVVSTKFYTGLTAGTTTFALLGRFRGLTGVEQSRSVTLLAPPTINSFTASPSTYITKNNAITLTWNTTNAVQVDITVSVDGGITTTIINNGSADGSTSYTPTVAGTLTFTLYAENAVGTGLGRVSTTTTVISVNPPVINSITNNPVIPDQDSTFTLSWDTTDATTVSIPGLGSNLPGDGNQSVIATVDQSGAGGYPGAPSFGNGYRDYTITASNLAGTTVSSSLRVFIKPLPPRITLYSISPSEVNFGGTITFTWTTIYSLSGSINSSVGATTPIASGTKTAIVTGNIQDFVSNSTKTYTMSVTGYGGTESNSYNVNVLIDTTPNSWVFSSKTGAAINTTYYASSLGTSPL